MLLDELHKYYGTWTHLSKRLDLSSSTYQLWRKRGYIPFKTQLLIEHKTNGRFKADPRHGEPEKKLPM